MRFTSAFFVFIIFFTFSSYSKNQVYHLTVENKLVNLTGKDVKHALAINGSIPAPTLRFKLGDTAVIHVTNKTNEPTTLHWHGILVPWNMDGPAFSNNKLIQASETFTFQFPIKHAGTYWYHSHTNLQEQRGLYGAIVIEEPRPRYYFKHDLVAVLSDWTNEKPIQVLKNLKKEGEYYSFKKKFFPSLLDAIFKSSFKDFIKGEWTGMGVMDLSDVGYDAFLINGKQQATFSKIKSGDRVRLRVINAAASTHFYLNLGQHRFFKVISKDGMGVSPVRVNEVFLGMGETYDLSFKMPPITQGLEFRATASDFTGHGSLIFGKDQKYEKAPSFAKPNPYKMDHDHSKMKHGDHSKMKHSKMKHDHSKMKHDHSKIKTQSMKKSLDYNMLKSLTKTNYSNKYPRHDIDLELSGSMSNYTWSLNGKTFSQDKYINVKKGDVVRFHFANKTMMTHPMHLHGHFFRVLNGQKNYSPLFHTVDVKPFEKITIEAYMNAPGLWMFHCHNLYHMKMGMGRLIKYEDFKRPQDLIEEEKLFSKDFIKDSSWFFKTHLLLFTNQSEIKWSAKKKKLKFSIKGKVDGIEFKDFKSFKDFESLKDPKAFKLETKASRKVSKNMHLLGGAFYQDQKWLGVLGLTYKLPLLIYLEALIKTNKELEVELEKEIPIISRLGLDMEYELKTKDFKIYKNKLEMLLSYQIHSRFKLGVFYEGKYQQKEDHQSVGVGLEALF
ncbi:MAG: multicopper oxidase family protein [Bdellovibrionales bacterium]